MTAEEIDALFARTLAGADLDDKGAWEAVHALRASGSRDVFERAAAWCAAADPLQRARGADVLAQLGGSSDPARRQDFSSASFPLVAAMARAEQDARPLHSALMALGHLGDMRAIPLIVAHQFHPAADVRFAVAFALGLFANDARAAAALLALTEDSDGEVRDWATFGLGVQGEADSPAIRAALLRCLGDANEEVREEAMVGLAKRRDRQALPMVIELLERRSHVSPRAIDAARFLLDLADEPDERDGSDYAAALRERFPP
ncbi:MAG TPA: HEAT repeat domain-containing protein [Stellaceae bacterium]|nr:HEAT repeat domain-containing protein [Stellaceae bacterium]